MKKAILVLLLCACQEVDKKTYVKPFDVCENTIFYDKAKNYCVLILTSAAAEIPCSIADACKEGK